jgi:ABC-type branched-subunit amino acid transport system ATPase component
MAEGKALATGRLEELRRHPEVVRAYLGTTAA